MKGGIVRKLFYGSIFASLSGIAVLNTIPDSLIGKLIYSINPEISFERQCNNFRSRNTNDSSIIQTVLKDFEERLGRQTLIPQDIKFKGSYNSFNNAQEVFLLANSMWRDFRFNPEKANLYVFGSKCEDNKQEITFQLQSMEKGILSFSIQNEDLIGFYVSPPKVTDYSLKASFDIVNDIGFTTISFRDPISGNFKIDPNKTKFYEIPKDFQLAMYDLARASRETLTNFSKIL